MRQGQIAAGDLLLHAEPARWRFAGDARPACKTLRPRSSRSKARAGLGAAGGSGGAARRSSLRLSPRASSAFAAITLHGCAPTWSAVSHPATSRAEPGRVGNSASPSAGLAARARLGARSWIRTTATSPRRPVQRPGSGHCSVAWKAEHRGGRPHCRRSTRTTAPGRMVKAIARRRALSVLSRSGAGSGEMPASRGKRVSRSPGPLPGPSKKATPGGQRRDVGPGRADVGLAQAGGLRVSAARSPPARACRTPPACRPPSRS